MAVISYRASVLFCCLLSIFEVQCTRSSRGGIMDNVNHAKYGSELLPFPLLALHPGQEERCWKIESRKHQESLQIVLKDKTKNTGILCICVFVCMRV